MVSLDFRTRTDADIRVVPPGEFFGDLTDEGRTAGWRAFETAPAPVGYDPKIIPGWDTPTSPTFGIVRLRPWRLHVLRGADLVQGNGAGVTWSRALA